MSELHSVISVVTFLLNELTVSEYIFCAIYGVMTQTCTLLSLILLLTQSLSTS